MRFLLYSWSRITDSGIVLAQIYKIIFNLSTATQKIILR
jgi:hypothetical protein